MAEQLKSGGGAAGAGQEAQVHKIPIPLAITAAAQKIDAGDLRPAEILLRQVLERQPENPYALHLLGLIAHKVGRGELALELIGKAIEIKPDEARFHSNRGEICRQLKRLDEAISHGQKAVELAPDFAIAHSNLGIAYYDKKDYDKAEECQKKALELDPNLVQAHNNLGSINRARKDRSAAIECFKKALSIKQDYLESMNNLGAMLVEDDKADEAIEILVRALKINPNYPEAHNNIANAFMTKELYDRAAAAYSNALRLRPEYPEAMLGLARVHKENDKLDEALVLVKRVLEIDPDREDAYCLRGEILLKMGNYAECREAYMKALSLNNELLPAHIGLGQLEMELGNLQEAKNRFEEAINIKPDEVAPYVFMAQAKKMEPEDPVVARLEEEAEKIDTLPKTRAMSLHFALGKTYDDIGDYDRAFPHFLEGCRMKREQIKYNPDAQDRFFQSVRHYFTRERIEKLSGSGDPSDLPIFVLGMPRSGTTLVETILASHPDVFAAGELHDMLRIANQPKPGVKSEGFPLSMQGLTKEDLAQMGRRYVTGLRNYSADSPRITDKMPGNFMVLGLIHLILPNAKIIHVKRNAADVCLSAFTKHFVKNSQYFSYDLKELGRYYANYADLMEHWRQVLPEGAFYEVQYEELVSDPQAQTRALLDYCGLTWNDACLSPHKTERSVKTASVAQVREPIYTRSVERWRRYEKHLGPLMEALGKYAPTAP